MMNHNRKQPWRGAPQPVTPADNQFMQNLLAGVRRIREQATNRIAPPNPDGGLKNGTTRDRKSVV